MQTVDPNIIQSTTVKTIKELKKLGESRNFENEDDMHDSTVSGKDTPEDEKSKTQYTKIKLNKKVSLTYQKVESQRQIEDQQETKSNLKRGSQRYTSTKLKQQQPQQQQQIDMIQANSILQKSKPLKDFYEQMQLTQTQINKFLRDDKHFQISFQSLLDKLIQNGKLQPTMLNVQKPALSTIEQFTINHVKRCLQKVEINQLLNEKQKTIESLFSKYYKEINNYENNLVMF